MIVLTGDTVTLKVGDTKTEITVDNAGNGGTGSFDNRGGFSPGDRNGQGDSSGRDGQNPFDNKEGNTPPELPNGSGEGGTFPQRPNEDKDPPQSLDGNFPSGDMPEKPNGTPPEMPNGDNGERPQMPDGEQGKDKNGQFDPFSGDRQNSIGQREEMETEDNGKTDFRNKKQTNSFDTATLFLIAVSIVVLAGGLFVVFKKKY